MFARSNQAIGSALQRHASTPRRIMAHVPDGVGRKHGGGTSMGMVPDYLFCRRPLNGQLPLLIIANIVRHIKHF